ncbi:MAG: ATP-dependent helicase [Deltaproteobacteria bacterium]|nr:MAG: ATP-dependent helicase [Deltaproteobacteria bacterium]
METYTLRPRPDARPEPRYRIDYEGELNPAQYAAATTLEGPVLVVAGAGSGKTRTLVYRVARLVESGVNPAQILLLTFTRKAAEEMLRRASMLVGGSCEQVAGGTFHSFANTVLRRAARRLGLKPGFTILDRSDSEDVVNLLRSRAGLDRKDRRFPRKGAIVEIFSMAVNRSTTVPALLEDGYSHLYEHLDDLVRLEEGYRRYKREQDLVDYDDLLVLLRDLLRDHPEAAAHLSRSHRYVMVDEYQDTNRLQAEIVRGLAVAHRNVMAVGDDSQSIYSFRGATFRNIMEFPDLFPGTRIIKLEENYRSTQPILDLANAVIERAADKHTKILHAHRGPGGPPSLVQCSDEQAQSRFVCQRILELREEGVSLDEIAVLFRSSFHSFDLELELQRADLPFVKRGGFKFIETAHVKDALAHLRIVANPRDAVSWHRVLLLLDGVGPKTADDIFAHVVDAPTIEAVSERLAAYPRRGAYAKDLGRLAALLAEIAPDEMLPGEKVARVVGFYTPMLRQIHRDDFPKREKDLEHFITIAGRYRSLASLLADMALEPPTDSVGDVLAARVEEGLLTLSTIHSAKGLEWHTVFVIWLVDGRFPSYLNLHDGDEVEEERRLLYVAVTRAKDNLYLSYPIDIYDRAAGMVLGQPSRFVQDLPEAILPGMQVIESGGFR